MVRKLRLVVSILLCTSQAFAQTIERVQPVRLSEEQLARIHDGVREAIKAVRPTESVRFGNIIGGNDGQGFLQVCGWVSTKGGPEPFSGFLADNRFVLFRVGSDPRTFEATLLACRLRGLGL